MTEAFLIMKIPLIKTSNRVISVVADEGSKSYDRTIKETEAILAKIIKGSEAKAIVLSVVLREMLKMKKGKSMGFDFGSFKEFKLTRTK